MISEEPAFKACAVTGTCYDPGGQAIFTTPNIAYWRCRLDLTCLGRWNPVGDDMSIAEPWRDPHIRFFTPSILARLIEQHGFTVADQRGYHGAALRDCPFVRHRVTNANASRFYRRVERRWPALLALNIATVATKAS